MKKALAFTLLELLIVVAIMMMLISILMPALRSARERTLEIACQGNMKQCGAALSMYAADYAGVIPPYNLSNYGYTGEFSVWTSFLMTQGYISGGNGIKLRDSAYMNIVRCPVLPISNTKGLSNYNYYKTYGLRSTYNGACTPTIRFWKIWNETTPSASIWIADTVYVTTNTYYQYEQYDCFDGGFNLPEGGSLNLNNSIHLRHKGLADCWFLDGHVEGCNEMSLKEKGARRIFSKGFVAIDF